MAARRKTKRGTTFAQLEKLALAYPGMEEGTSYGTPAFKIRKKLLARMHQDGETLVLRTTPDEQEALLEAAPEIFFLTPHYEGHAWILVRLSKIAPPDLDRLVGQAWRDLASRKQLTEFETRD